MVSDYFGQKFDLGFFIQKCQMKKRGTSMLSLSKAAKAVGLKCKGVKMKIDQLKMIVRDIPVVLHWNKSHFVVVYKAPKPGKPGKFHVADPAMGLVSYGEYELVEGVSRSGKAANRLAAPGPRRSGACHPAHGHG